jgi:hypothetical protein
MDAMGAVGMRARRLVVLVVLVVAVALPLTGVPASAATANGPVVKVGMITALTGPLASNPDTKDALVASLAAFNKRGGAGTNHAKLQADVCDTKSDANGEVDCAHQMVDDGVVATLNDLTFYNPAGVVDVLESAGIPRIGLLPTSLPEFQSKFSFPVSAGAIAAYLGNAVGFKQDGNTKICLMRTDAPTGATFKGFLAPSFTAIGVDIACDVSVATGATDYAPYIAQVADCDVVVVGQAGANPIKFIKQAKDENLGDIVADANKALVRQMRALVQRLDPQPDEDRAAQIESVEDDMRRVRAEFADPRNAATHASASAQVAPIRCAISVDSVAETGPMGRSWAFSGVVGRTSRSTRARSWASPIPAPGPSNPTTTSSAPRRFST